MTTVRENPDMKFVAALLPLLTLVTGEPWYSVALNPAAPVAGTVTRTGRTR